VEAVDASHPAARILLLLTATVGRRIPARRNRADGAGRFARLGGGENGRGAYWLYALEPRIAAGLLAFPIAIEPALSIRAQALVWSADRDLLACARAGVVRCARGRARGGNDDAVDPVRSVAATGHVDLAVAHRLQGCLAVTNELARTSRSSRCCGSCR
jgi:hypothetical protein